MGEIIDGDMYLSAIGEFAMNNLETISNHNQYAEIPLYVIMPNHIHAIISIDGNFCRDVARYVCSNELDVDDKMRNVASFQSLLSTVVRGFKSVVTKYAHDNNMEFSWQSRYYDNIIRNENSMKGIVAYIENNVILWDMDRLNANT